MMIIIRKQMTLIIIVILIMVIIMKIFLCYDVSWGVVMSPVWFMGLLACASVAIGLTEDQGLTVTYPLLWQQ